MVHKCVRCGALYDDNDKSIINGCKRCGSPFFLYIRDVKDAEEFERIRGELEKRRVSFEDELKKGIEKFGVETIRMPREGVFEINIDALMKKEPLILLAKGKAYFIYLPSVFEKFKKAD